VVGWEQAEGCEALLGQRDTLEGFREGVDLEDPEACEEAGPDDIRSGTMSEAARRRGGERSRREEESEERGARSEGTRALWAAAGPRTGPRWPGGAPRQGRGARWAPGGPRPRGGPGASTARNAGKAGCKAAGEAGEAGEAQA